MTKAHATSPDDLGQGSLRVFFRINRRAVNTKAGACDVSDLMAYRTLLPYSGMYSLRYQGSWAPYGFPRSSYGVTYSRAMSYLYPTIPTLPVQLAEPKRGCFLAGN